MCEKRAPLAPPQAFCTPATATARDRRRCQRPGVMARGDGHLQPARAPHRRARRLLPLDQRCPRRNNQLRRRRRPPRSRAGAATAPAAGRSRVELTCTACGKPPELEPGIKMRLSRGTTILCHTRLVLSTYQWCSLHSCSARRTHCSARRSNGHSCARTAVAESGRRCPAVISCRRPARRHSQPTHERPEPSCSSRPSGAVSGQRRPAILSRPSSRRRRAPGSQPPLPS